MGFVRGGQIIQALGNTMAAPGKETQAKDTRSASTAKQKPVRRFLLWLRGAIGRNALTLCWVLYAFGLLWLLLHPVVTVSTGELKCRGTYISENALLIDTTDASVTSRDMERARAHQRAVSHLPSVSTNSGCGTNCSDVIEWVEGALRSIDRVEVYRHEWIDKSYTIHHKRTNVYAILRASPLADRKESVVLAARYGHMNAKQPFTGVSVGIAMLEFLAAARWLAKDIILLVAHDGGKDGSDGYAPGTDAWLRAYHMDPIIHKEVQSLPMRAGVIRAALNLESLGDLSRSNSVGIFAAGINGQLPNLDLINTAVRAHRSEGITSVLDRCDGYPTLRSATACDDILYQTMRGFNRMIHAYASPSMRASFKQYTTNLNGMLRFMKTLAIGPSGPHANFISYNIDSVTLAPIERPGERSGTLKPLKWMRSIELIVRALSNLEEKLHQSFFLYVLPNVREFVSVGEYYYPVVLAIFPAIIHTVDLAGHTVGMRLAYALVVFAICEVVGAVWFLFALKASVPILPGVILVGGEAVVVFLLAPWMRKRALLGGCPQQRQWTIQVRKFEMQNAIANQEKEKSQPPTPEEVAYVEQDVPEPDSSGWRALKFLTMVLLVYPHSILGILNYPMAAFGAFPMAFYALVKPLQQVGSRLQAALYVILLVAVSPPCLLYAPSLMGWAPDSSIADLMVRGFLLKLNQLALPYVAFLYVPVHIMSCVVLLSPTSTSETKGQS